MVPPVSQMRALIFVDSGSRALERALPPIVVDEAAVSECNQALRRRGFHFDDVDRDCSEEHVRDSIIAALRALSQRDLLVVVWVGYAIDNGNGDVRLFPSDKPFAGWYPSHLLLSQVGARCRRCWCSQAAGGTAAAAADGGLPLNWIVNKARDGPVEELCGSMLVLVDALEIDVEHAPSQKKRMPLFQQHVDDAAVRQLRVATTRTLQRCTVFGSSSDMATLRPSVLKCFTSKLVAEDAAAGAAAGAGAGAGVGHGTQAALRLIPTLDSVAMALPTTTLLSRHSMYSNVHRHHAYHGT